LEVSRIAFGTWQLGGEWGSVDADEAKAAIRHAIDLGVSFFDTAQAYGFGASERMLGEALRQELDSNRDSVIIATKGGINPGKDPARDSSREWLRKGIHSSLAALGVDYIDLYQVHWPDERTAFEDTAGYLQEMVAEGLIRHVGVSNFDAEQMAAFSTVRSVETLQPPYHLFRRGIEAEVLPYCIEHNIGVLVYSPLGSGLPTGRMTKDTTFEVPAPTQEESLSRTWLSWPSSPSSPSSAGCTSASSQSRGRWPGPAYMSRSSVPVAGPTSSEVWPPPTSSSAMAIWPKSNASPPRASRSRGPVRKASSR
jgi:aryl-alcohol dehydrogenase-like predicted oxidoreductase